MLYAILLPSCAYAINAVCYLALGKVAMLHATRGEESPPGGSYGRILIAPQSRFVHGGIMNVYCSLFSRASDVINRNEQRIERRSTASRVSLATSVDWPLYRASIDSVARFVGDFSRLALVGNA